METGKDMNMWNRYALSMAVVNVAVINPSCRNGTKTQPLNYLSSREPAADHLASVFTNNEAGSCDVHLHRPRPRTALRLASCISRQIAQHFY